MTNSKVCFMCKVAKPLDDFYRDSTRKDGHQQMCKVCRREYQDKYSTTDKWKALHRKKQAGYSLRHPERSKIYAQAQQVPLAKSCERCGVSGIRLVRHHPDYSEPKKVITLCSLCHGAIHKELKNA